MSDQEYLTHLQSLDAGVEQLTSQAITAARAEFARMSPFEQMYYLRTEAIKIKFEIEQAQQIYNPAAAAIRFAELSTRLEALECLTNE